MHANGTKAAASLSSGLLARKGGARPAMRRQAIQATPSPTPEGLDDLGWNDMGDETPTAVDSAAARPSPVARQVAMLHAGLSPAAPRPAASSTAEATAASVRKCAFTLRLDAERHLRLRLLSAVTNRSAQQLVTDALDALIARHPNIEDLAADPKARTSPADPSAKHEGTMP